MGYDAYDCEPIEWQRICYPQARKPHVCSACRETIRMGDQYLYDVSKWDGSVHTIRRCMRCDAIYQHLVGRADWDHVIDPMLDCGEDYQAAWSEDPPDDIAALAFALPGEVEGTGGGHE